MNPLASSRCQLQLHTYSGHHPAGSVCYFQHPVWAVGLCYFQHPVECICCFQHLTVGWLNKTEGGLSAYLSQFQVLNTVDVFVLPQAESTLLVTCANGHVVQVESPEPGSYDTLHTYELSGLTMRVHHFKSVKSRLRVGTENIKTIICR